ncbi:transglutaminase domain-containing protein [Anaeromicropila herbilytica]|uniref:Transglutaminase-like domain-containing protein n=1 Tax=Anaeromicropila herbilytica TaxID=2785025 RepID=A0A7R7IBY7_9FIRM|nr:transglutaminase domain-containing protein [Anaeromicropila herbilytica]BCN29329.1 hypothetical protein bsdtb5_06240 [Anaeromicropila herbilytica]
MNIKLRKKGISIIATLILVSILGCGIKVQAKTYNTEQEIINEIRKNLLARDKQFTINISADMANKMGSNSQKLISKAITIDKSSTAKDADYLAYSYKNYRIQWEIIGSSATLTYNIDYYLNSTQEQQVDNNVKSILKKLNLSNASDYKKVKAIHDYIIKSAIYDETYSRYTAYDIFVNKTAVCQGYTLAAYRLFTEAGLKSKIITGYAKGGSHAWNIVKVNGKWYNIDLTWDDPLTYNRKQVLRYDYFLKNDKDFSDHIRDTEFTTKDFLSKYAITSKSY